MTKKGNVLERRIVNTAQANQKFAEKIKKDIEKYDETSRALSAQAISLIHAINFSFLKLIQLMANKGSGNEKAMAAIVCGLIDEPSVREMLGAGKEIGNVTDGELHTLAHPPLLLIPNNTVLAKQIERIKEGNYNTSNNTIEDAVEVLFRSLFL
ncbi:MAG: hypothetical protein HZB80_08640 [Deltaproteobacteria bacterium]|nr:hypothetical protein [Deltaproteobacteria bacterium]